MKYATLSRSVASHSSSRVRQGPHRAASDLLDGARQRGRLPMPVVGVPDGLVERLVMDVIQARGVMSASARRGVAAFQERAKEVVHLLARG